MRRRKLHCRVQPMFIWHSWRCIIGIRQQLFGAARYMHRRLSRRHQITLLAAQSERCTASLEVEKADRKHPGNSSLVTWGDDLFPDLSCCSIYSQPASVYYKLASENDIYTPATMPPFSHYAMPPPPPFLLTFTLLIFIREKALFRMSTCIHEHRS